ncbi:hypothetical protein V2J09_006094 [Rumex salicifolius]
MAELSVCVTGGSGFIGSWLVQMLLERGYNIHATVKDLMDEDETAHLLALEGADTRLKLFQMDLLDYDSIAAAISGTVGVFHVASPNIIDQVEDPEKELLEPAIRGTEYVLRAAKLLGVRRVVITSSTAAIRPSPFWPADAVMAEDCWTDLDYCKGKKLWYPISKTMAEKLAWRFAEDNDFDVVTVNPGMTLGPILPPVMNATMLVLVRLLQGSTEALEDLYMGCVHVKDVALAHILVYENPSASGRHLCVESISHFGDFAAKVSELYPEYSVPRFQKETQPGLVRAKNVSTKLMEMGLNFIPMEKIIRDSIHGLKSLGYLT